MFRNRHTAGYWFWEVEDLPRSMHGAFDIVDEVWAATDFIAEAVRDPIIGSLTATETLKGLLGIAIVAALGSALSAVALRHRLRTA